MHSASCIQTQGGSQIKARVRFKCNELCNELLSCEGLQLCVCAADICSRPQSQSNSFSARNISSLSLLVFLTQPRVFAVRALLLQTKTPRHSGMELMLRNYNPRPSWQHPVLLPWQCCTAAQRDKGQDTSKELPVSNLLFLFLAKLILIAPSSLCNEAPIGV